MDFLELTQQSVADGRWARTQTLLPTGGYPPARMGMVNTGPKVRLREASVCPLGNGLWRSSGGWSPFTGCDESVGLSGADLQRILLPGRLGTWGVSSGYPGGSGVPGLGLGGIGFARPWCLMEKEGQA